MSEICTIGEILVEIMRKDIGVNHNEKGVYLGPYPSGAPAIFADACSNLGIKTSIIGSIGKDQFGEVLINKFKESKLNLEYINLSDKTTGVAFVSYDKFGDRSFIYHINNSAATDLKIEKINFENLKYFHVMGSSMLINEQMSFNIREVAKLAIKNGAKITFDPNIRKELMKDDKVKEDIKFIVNNSSIIFPSSSEILTITGESSIDSALKLLFDTNKNLEIVVTKLGDKGCFVTTRDEQLSLKSYNVKEIDPTGAGDTFDGAFLAGLIKGFNIKQSAKIANAAGALNVSCRGPMESNLNFDKIKNLIKKDGDQL